MQGFPPPFAAAEGPYARRGDQGIRFLDALRFAFVLENPWGNLLLAAVYTLVPIAGPLALYGYQGEILQRLVRRHPNPIPRLDFADLSHYLSRGVPTFLVALVIGLPVGLLFGAFFFVGFFAFGITGALAGGSSGHGAGPDAALTTMLILGGVGFAAVLVGGPVLAVLGNAAVTRAELTEDFGQTFQLTPFLAYVRLTFASTLLTYVGFSLLAIPIAFAGMLACYVGLFVVGPILQLAYVHLRWQIYEQYLARGGEPIAMKEPVSIPSEAARGMRTWQG